MTATLKVLHQLARDQVQAQRDVQEAEEQLKRAKAKLDDIRTKTLPTAMDELNLETFKTTDGIRISIKEDIRASASRGRIAEIVGWLHEHGHDKIIKRTISLIARDPEHAEAVHQRLEGEEITDEPKIHPQTLSAFVRQSLEDGVDIPMETFGVFRQRVSHVRV